MDQYVGLDVSLKETFVCVVDACGEFVCEKSVGTTPETIAKFIEKGLPGPWGQGVPYIDPPTSPDAMMWRA